MPSSEKATQPARASSRISVSSRPSRLRVTAPMGRTSHSPTCRARSTTWRTTPAWSSRGCVFGMQHMVVTPPAAAAREPDSMSSFHSSPGSRRCTCMSTSPGQTMRPPASSVSSAGPESAATMRPSSMNRSATSSRPEAGSTMRPPRMCSLMPPPPRRRTARSAPPCARPRRFPPGRGCGRGPSRPRRWRFQHRGSSAPDA